MNGRNGRARGRCSVRAQTEVQVRARMHRAEALAALVTANAAVAVGGDSRRRQRLGAQGFGRGFARGGGNMK